jgi:hypothetical protein
MFYWGGNGWYPNTFTIQVGVATSTDNGQSWNKYDNPLTTDPPYAESDPVLTVGPEGSYDARSIFGATVIKNGSQWEMYYLGTSPTLETDGICYATSTDAINWRKDEKNPIFTFWQDPAAVYDILEMPTAVLKNDTCYMYYDYGTRSAGIGLASDPAITITDNSPSVKQVDENITREFILYPNYPNPFNPSTLIMYQLSKTARIELCIYDMMGKKVITLVSEKQIPGIYRVKWDARGQASGIYYCRLQAGGLIKTKKMLLVQ